MLIRYFIKNGRKPFDSILKYSVKAQICSSIKIEKYFRCEDYLQNPLQPLAEHLEAPVYEVSRRQFNQNMKIQLIIFTLIVQVFEKDQTKYDTYQKAFHNILEQWSEDRVPVVMVVGAGRGPLVQAVLNVSNILSKKVTFKNQS